MTTQETATERMQPVEVELRRSGLAQAFADARVVAWRNLRGGLRVPDNLVYMLIQPIMFVLLFAYVFGGAIPVPGSSDPTAYRQYLMAGIFAQTMSFAVAPASVGLADDMHKGLIDRFRSLPMARSAVITGGVLSNLAMQFFILVVMMGCGLIVGWRWNEGFVSFLAAVGLLMLFAFAMLWIGALIGLSVGNPQVAASAGLVWLFPVTFLSNAFVPTPAMPGWLQPVAEWNPISSVVAACRDLFGNPNPFASNSFAAQHPVMLSLMWIALITAVFAPLAIRKYRRTVAR